MRKRTVSVYLRVREGAGKQPYYPAAYAQNGALRPLHALIQGKPVQRPDGNYYLRYRTRDGKRQFEFCGADPKLATTMRLQRQHVIAGEDLGLATVPTPPAARPPKTESEISVEGLENPLAMPAETASGRLPLAKTIDAYVKEKQIKTGRSKGYRFPLAEFLKQSRLTYLDQVDDEAVVAYIAHLVKLGKSASTIEGRIVTLTAFLRRYKLEKQFRCGHAPKPTLKLVRTYSPGVLKALFAVATPEERMTFTFFLQLGMREREVMFAAWTDIDWGRNVFRVTEKTDVGFRIKDREERDIPIPPELMTALKSRWKAAHHPRWIFPTPKGQPNGHLLRDLQKLALRAGLNCGRCATKGGKSCREEACCRGFGLHDFRRTFATAPHQAGVSVRQLMLWLGHSNMETTLRYLAGADAASEEVRAQVEKTWNGWA
jgi:integrase/recombinase XerD